MTQDKTDQPHSLESATFASWGAGEWGIPDWTDEMAYGESGDWTIARWLWEFTRRRDDYRSETMQYFQLCEKVEAALRRKQSDPAPEAKSAYHALCDAKYEAWQIYWKNWGYSPPLDPRVSDYQQKEMLRWAHRGVWHMLGSSPEAKHRNTMTPNHDELAIRINLDLPLAEQLELVRQAARRAQKERHGRLLQRRRHCEKWIGYLRALDARSSNAKLSEMVQVFFSDGTIDRHKAPEGGYREPALSAVSKLISAGEDLQLNFPI